MKSRLILFLVVCWLMGAAALAASTVSAQGKGGVSAYLPLSLRQRFVNNDPLLSHYIGLATSKMDGDADYYTVYPNGTGWVNVTRNDVDDYDGAWSPDGKTLLYGNVNGTWLLPLANGSPVQLTTRPDPYSVDAWSPSGKYLLYRGEDTAETHEPVYLYTPATNTATSVGVDNAVAELLVWSPDGAQVAIVTYDATRTLPAQLWLYTPEDTDLQLLAEGNGFDTAQWSPAGTEVMVTRRVTTEGTDRYTVLISDTAGAVTTVADGFQASAWVDNGARLLLWDDGILFLDKRDGSVPLPFSLEVQNVLAQVSVSPEGTRVIYYETVQGAEFSYFRTTAEGNRPVALGGFCSVSPKPNSFCTQRVTWAADGATFITNSTVAASNVSYDAWSLSDATVTPPVTIEEYFEEERAFYLPSSSRFISTLSGYQLAPLYYVSHLIDIEGGRRDVPLPNTGAFVEAWRFIP